MPDRVFGTPSSPAPVSIRGHGPFLRNRRARFGPVRDRHNPRVLPDSPGFLEPDRPVVAGAPRSPPSAPPRRFGELCPRPRAPAGARHRSPYDARPYYTVVSSTRSVSTGERYGEPLATNRPGENAEAVKTLQDLVARSGGATHVLGRPSRRPQVWPPTAEAGLATFSRAMNLFPRNIPLSLAMRMHLRAPGAPRKRTPCRSHLFNAVEPTPEQIRQIALCRKRGRRHGESHLLHERIPHRERRPAARLPAKASQLALAAPNLTPVQRKRYAARLKEIRDFLTEKVPRYSLTNPQQDDSGQRLGPWQGRPGGRAAPPICRAAPVPSR